MLLIRNIAFYTAFYLISPFYVIAALLLVFASKQGFRRVVREWSQFHRAILRWFVGIEVRIEGERSDEPVLYAIRHESFFEAIDTPANFTNPVTFAKQELAMIPGWGFVAGRFGMIFVARDQGATALRKMVREARYYAGQGRPLVIFPEGTRVPHGERRKLQAGFAGIYKMIRLPVVPVAVNSGPLYHHGLKRPGVITYRFGEMIPAGLDRKEVEARVTNAINALNADGFAG